MSRSRQRGFIPGSGAGLHSATMIRTALLLSLCCLAACPARAENVVAQPAHVREEYAQVLRVDPVYQTLRAWANEEQCDPLPPVSGQRGIARLAELREARRREEGGNCRVVRVQREFRRPIAYDVEYQLRGVKYRSRLPYDPGKRLRVRVSVEPVRPD